MPTNERAVGSIEVSRIVMPLLLSLVVAAGWAFHDAWVDALVGLFPDRIAGIGILNRLQIVVSWIVGAWLFARLVNAFFWRGFVERASGTRVPSLLTDMFGFLVAVGAVIGILITALDLSMVHVLLIVAGLTVLLAIFLRRSIEDLFTGISLNFDPSFNIGDIVEIGDGVRGRVEEITWRTARLSTESGELVTVPNAVVASGVLRNYSRPNASLGTSLRVVLDYAVPPDRARRILANAARGGDEGEQDTRVYLRELNPSGAVYEVLFRAPSTEAAEATRTAIAERVVRHLDYAGVSLSGAGNEALLEQARAVRPHSEERLAALLREVSLFADLDPETAAELARDAYRMEFQPGQYLYRAGEPGDHVFVITEGRVRLIRAQDDGTAQVVAEPGPGETAGVAAMLTGEPVRESARAALPTVAYDIGKSSVEAILARRPELAAMLARKAVEMRLRMDRRSDEMAAADDADTGAEVNELLGKIKGVFKSGFLASLTGQYKGRLKERCDETFLKATMAAAALVAAADNEISDAERNKVSSIFDELDMFEGKDRDKGVRLFNDDVRDIIASPAEGVATAMAQLAPLAGDTEAAETIVRICFALCEADGVADPVEEQRVREICRTLKVPAQKFGL